MSFLNHFMPAKVRKLFGISINNDGFSAKYLQHSDFLPIFADEIYGRKGNIILKQLMKTQNSSGVTIEEYRLFVISLSHGNNGEGINRTFLNSDKEKALVVLVELFKSAKNSVRIFAANLCNYVGTEPEYIEALSDFIEKGGEVKILLNSFAEENVRNSKLFKRLAYYKSEGKNIVVKKTAVKPYYVGDENKNEVHFTIADDKGYRIETDVEKRTARCNFNNPDEAKSTAEFFDKVFENPESSEINLLTVFGYGAQ